VIAIDWGTSSLRLYQLDAAGCLIGERRAAQGILACQGAFETVLAQQLVGWEDPLIVLAGMIGSRQGWMEVSYVECPATLGDIARGMVHVEAPSLPGRSLWIVPGLLFRGATPNSADVLRGEETQLLGLLNPSEAERQVVCLPGTHSKWVLIGSGCIDSFLTAMTGELFEVLRRHSLLGRLMPAGQGSIDQDACRQAMVRAQEPGGVLHHLFSVRTSGLLGTLTIEQLPSYLSALLIAHEVLELPLAAQLRAADVQLIGSTTLLKAYALVLHELGIGVTTHSEALAARGAYHLARERGLL
jgi:2-dehydro-3-deoxygalactonokinase